MSSAGIEVTWDDREVRDYLRKLQGRLGDLRPAFGDIGELLIERTRQRFRDGQDAAGNPWDALSPVTLARRDKAGVSGTKPGIGESKRLSTEWAWQITDGGKAMEFGSALIQSAVFALGAERHSFTGGRTPWGDIPARDPITPSDQTVQDILDILREHIEG